MLQYKKVKKMIEIKEIMSIKNYAELLQEVTAISQTYVKDGNTIYVMTEKGKKILHTGEERRKVVAMIALYLKANRMIQGGTSTSRIDGMLLTGKLQNQVLIGLKDKEDQDK